VAEEMKEKDKKGREEGGKTRREKKGIFFSFLKLLFDLLTCICLSEINKPRHIQCPAVWVL
jgi:hypothetical protein